MPASPKVPSVTEWPIGEGISLTLSEDRSTATIVADLTGNLGQTGSSGAWGKNIMVAKTVGGAVDVPSMAGWKLQFSLYRLPLGAEATSMKAKTEV